ncbi:sensor histidine kinase [Echinimonas agarilytica]|uniref:histidine kinase n=1 Tax=Echinimonas agarilytica TaxID=1215918 RepID=A0AA41W6G7_9GAMM|nr:HAMP domain-containing sensor histidine kinase [Echinimonas agarilytica]MCM2679774.1 HAMP domain-containing histidine kinase [Echinimonas agarilytica]
MTEKPPNIEFSSVLAACVHDMKNSLFMLLQSIEQLAASENMADEKKQELAKLHYEAYRVNTNLMQLLGLYRLEKKSLPLNVEENFIADILDEMVAKNSLYLDNRGIEVTCEVDSDLVWYLDNDLISNLLSDIVNNALRYCDRQIALSAYISPQNELVVQIEDDGDGYPEQMLNFSLHGDMAEFEASSGRTGLGLYFAGLIAESHKNESKRGYIQLRNGGRFGGSVFTLTLP